MIAWIVCHGGRLPFVAGVFTSRARAHAEHAAMPADSRARCAVGSRGDLAFPCFILEAAGDIEFVTEAEALAVVSGARSESRVPPATEEDDEPVFLNLYRLEREFAPQRPGSDYMGAIPHWHLGARELEQVRRHGLSVLWTGPADEG